MVHEPFTTRIPPSRLCAALTRLNTLVNWETTLRAASPSSSLSHPSSHPLMRVSTEPARALLSRLSNPHHTFSSVHVTGSKGKGTVSAFISAALQRASFLPPSPIALYASPHVHRVNERIHFDTAQITDDALAESLEATLDALHQPPELPDATWYDVLTVSAMHAFRQHNVAMAVVEVGMGGRLDSTNVLSAPVAVVTNILDEHAEVIGPTLCDIAHEKAGIIAPGARAIVGVPPVGPLATVFKRHAAACNPPPNLTFLPRHPHMSFFEHNLALARAAVHAVATRYGHHTDVEVLLPDHVARDAMARLPARQQRFCVRGVDVMLDGAHVPASVHALLADCRQNYDALPVVVVALASDKKVPEIARVLVKSGAVSIVATQIGDTERDLSARVLGEELTAAAGEGGMQQREQVVGVCADAESALDKAIAEARRRDTHVVVLGSLYLARKLLPRLKELEMNRDASGIEHAVRDS